MPVVSVAISEKEEQVTEESVEFKSPAELRDAIRAYRAARFNLSKRLPFLARSSATDGKDELYEVAMSWLATMYYDEGREA